MILVGNKEYIAYADVWHELGDATGTAGADGEDGITFEPKVGSVVVVDDVADASVTVVVDTVAETATYNFA